MSLFVKIVPITQKDRWNIYLNMPKIFLNIWIIPSIKPPNKDLYLLKVLVSVQYSTTLVAAFIMIKLFNKN